jgi:hypothetical protein
MDAVFDLATKHLVPFRVLGDACLFSQEASMAFIGACESQGLPILGIECYLDSSTGLKLLPAELADFSLMPSTPREVFVRQTCQEARQFIRTLPHTQTLCEFVVS